MTTIVCQPPGRLLVSTRAHPNRKSVNARCATSLGASSSGLISPGEARRGSEDCTALSSESDTRLAAQETTRRKDQPDKARIRKAGRCPFRKSHPAWDSRRKAISAHETRSDRQANFALNNAVILQFFE